MVQELLQPCIKAAPCHRGFKGIKSIMDRSLHSQDLRNERAELDSSSSFTGGTLKV